MPEPVGVNPFSDSKPGRRVHQSPAGTYEKVLKSVLENPSLTDAEFRVLLYAATKPEDWVLSAKQIAAAIGRSPDHVERALTGLRKKGYVSIVTTTDERNRYRRRTSHLNRHKVIRET